MSNWKIGDKVFAFWEEDGYWYPATIIGINGERFRLRYNDFGEAEVTGSDSLEDFEVEIDDGVECWDEDEELYYDAVVVGTKGDRVRVEFDDGSKEWVPLDSLRYTYGEEWEEGERVFAFSDEDGYWYPATIVKITDENIQVRFDDGSTALLDDGDYLDLLEVEPGEEVECWWEPDKAYYVADVVEVQDTRVQVEFEDGTKQWTTIDHIRVEDEE